jgi:hypothetical protein
VEADAELGHELAQGLVVGNDGEDVGVQIPGEVADQQVTQRVRLLGRQDDDVLLVVAVGARLATT